MIEEIVAKLSLNDASSPKHDLAYWLSKTPEERVEAVELLRKAHYGSIGRIQRTVRVVQRKDIGRHKDLADIEAIEKLI